MDEDNTKKKVHKKAKSGAKVKRLKRKKSDGEGSNPKAFAVQSVNKTMRRMRYAMDMHTKKRHIPIVNRVPDEPPPILVAIVGPPKVGKSTLMQCIVKNYTRQRLTNIQGPVTLVTGKNRRITLIECENDVNCMIDIAKVADLVLLLVDATFGFEMEIFEFLNICQVHGFPRVMGVLTHLDSFKDGKVLRKTKKRLKNRFWTEIYKGAKLFYLSGMVYGEYQKNEVHNLCRFISVMKFRPLEWRLKHPYIVADRMEDITNQQLLSSNNKCDRDVCLYGYVRGTLLKANAPVHIPGCGDYELHSVEFISDPCPTPEREKKRSLDAKERLIYAPMSGVGGIVYDKDAVYVDVGHTQSTQVVKSEPSNELLATMMSMDNALDERITSSQLTLFSNSRPITSALADDEDKESTDDSGVEDDSDDSDDSDEAGEAGEVNEAESDSQHQRERPVYDDSDDDVEDDGEGDDDEIKEFASPTSIRTSTGVNDVSADDDEEDDDDDDDGDIKEISDNDDSMNEEDMEDTTRGAVRWKSHMVERAAELFRLRQTHRRNYNKIVYGHAELKKKKVPTATLR